MPDPLHAKSAEPLRLYTFTLSHFSEKIRWALELANVPFEEVPWTPFFHVLRVKKHGRRTTVPVLEAGSESIQDSTRILFWLEKSRAPFSLIPSDASERDAALSVEARFDDVGTHVLRYVYSHALEQTDNIVRYWTVDATPNERRVVRYAFPAMRFVFRKRFRLDATTAVRSRAVIEENLTWLEARVSRERPYLVGDRLSIADVTAASLLAPLAAPDEHPIYGAARYREGLARITDGLREREGLAWVRDMYRKHRGLFPRAAAIRAAVDAP